MIAVALVWIIGGGLVIGLSLAFLDNEGMASGLFGSIIDAFGRRVHGSPRERSSSHP